jgi:branched-chain amino acid transport system substrate-binding protein
MRLAQLLIAMALTSQAGGASAQTSIIGLAAPLSGPSGLLGEQMRAGAEAAAADRGVALEVADDACTAAGGSAAARRFVQAQVQAVTGFLCTEAIEAALPILTQAGIPVITTGVRTESLTDRRDKTGWLVFRLAPRADAETRAAARILGTLWRDELFAIIDDGTIYSRDLSEGLRLALEQQSLKPVYVDTFRPQLDNQIGLAGRLRKSGATHVFAGGDRSDLAILGRDAAAIGYDLTIAGGEVLRAAPEDVDLVPGTLMVGLPEWSSIVQPEAIERLRSRDIESDGYVLPTYAAVEIAAAAASLASQSGQPLSSFLAGEEFQTVLGSVGFDAKGDWSENPYRLFSYNGRDFVEVD